MRGHAFCVNQKNVCNDRSNVKLRDMFYRFRNIIFENRIKGKKTDTNMFLIVFKICVYMEQKYVLCIKILMVHVSHLMRKPTICICENKDTDQLCGNREADQRLCFRYTDSTVSPLILNF